MNWDSEQENLDPQSAPEQQTQPSLRPALSRPVFDRPAAPRPVETKRAPAPPPPVEPPADLHQQKPDPRPRSRRDPLLLLALFVLFIGGGLMQIAKDVKPPAAHLRPNVEPVAGEIIVDLVDNATSAQIAQLENQYGIELRFNSPHAVAHKLMVAVVQPDRRAGVLAGLRNNPLVEAVDTNDPVQIYTAPFKPNDPGYAKQWHLTMIGLEQAWNITKGAGAVVAVVDSGVGLPDKQQYRKPADFEQTKFVAGYDFVDKDDQPEDENHHGTHVAGTIAESTNNGLMGAGVAPEAAIMPVRVLDGDGSGSTSDVVDGIHYAADHGANVLNLSLGSPRANDVEEKAIAYAHDKGVILACAAGNDGKEPVNYPAAFQGCIAVSSVGPTKQLAPYSTFGDQIEIAGPGGDQSMGDDAGVWQNTFTRLRGPRGGRPGPEGFVSLQGTSMASPHVAGVAALLVSLGKHDPDEVRSILRKSATPLGSPKLFGAGLLNAEEAVQMTGQKPVQKWVPWAVLALGALVVYLMAEPQALVSALITMAAGLFFPLLVEKIVGFGSIWNLLGHAVIVPVIWLLTPNLARGAIQNAATFTFGLGLHFAIDIWTGASPFQVVPQRRIVLWFIVNLMIGAYLIVSAMLKSQTASQAAGQKPAYA